MAYAMRVNLSVAMVAMVNKTFVMSGSSSNGEIADNLNAGKFSILSLMINDTVISRYNSNENNEVNRNLSRYGSEL